MNTDSSSNPLQHEGWLSELIPGVPAQIWTIIFGTIITIIFIILIYKKLKKQNPNRAPKGFLLIMERYIVGFENFMTNITGNKLKSVYPYLFTLFNYILIMSLLSLIGFAPAPTAYSFTLILAIITFIGIYVIGIGTKGIWQFSKQKYKNPIEIFSQVAPVLSLSIRLFAATLATTILGKILNIVLVSMSTSPWIATWPLLASLWSWVWKFIETFFALLQAFVFVVLTTMYWLMEYGPSWDSKVRREFYKSEKRIKKDEAKTQIQQRRELQKNILNNS